MKTIKSANVFMQFAIFILKLFINYTLVQNFLILVK